MFKFPKKEVSKAKGGTTDTIIDWPENPVDEALNTSVKDTGMTLNLIPPPKKVSTRLAASIDKLDDRMLKAGIADTVKFSVGAGVMVSAAYLYSVYQLGPAAAHSTGGRIALGALGTLVSFAYHPGISEYVNNKLFKAVGFKRGLVNIVGGSLALGVIGGLLAAVSKTPVDYFWMAGFSGIAYSNLIFKNHKV